MWIYMAVAALAVIGIVGGIAGAGIFSIVLLPIAVIVLVAGLAFRGMGHSAEQSGAGGGASPPLPSSSPSDPARVQASPEDLADARRAQQ
jgi:predicted lipid-binding transport protein (Tim44 family)